MIAKSGVITKNYNDGQDEKMITKICWFLKIQGYPQRMRL